MAKNKEMYDTAAFPELLSTLSMKEAMEIEFRWANTNKWLNMILLKDPQKRLYLCTVCQVVQYSEKNLFSHLFGKKHFQKMGAVNKVRLPKINVPKTQPNKAIAKNNAPQPNKAIAKNAAAAAKSANLAKNTQPNKPIPTISKSNLAKPAAPKNSPNSAGAKNIGAAKKELVTKPNTPTEAAKKVLVTKPNAFTEAAKKALNPAMETAQKPPNTPIEAATKVLVTKPEILVETAKNDLTENAVKPAELKVTAKATNETQNITQTNTAETESTHTSEDNSKNCSNQPNVVVTIESPNASDNVPDQSKTSSNQPEVTANPSNVPTETAVPETASQSKVVGNSSNNSTKTPFPSSTNTTEDTSKISSNQPKVSSNAPKVHMEIKAEAETNIVNPLSQSNLVLNPLSKAAKDKKITCVPISKLISKPEIVENDDDVVMVTPEKPVEKVANKAKEPERVTENPPNPNPKAFPTPIRIVKPINIRPTPVPTPVTNTGASTFESTTNVSEVLGLLGVEYVLKIVRRIGDTTARFLCSLCSITTDELAMHNHLLSNNHRLKYCEQHFPTAIRQYKQYVSEVPQHQVYKVLTPILNKLAIAIEKHHGRENSYLCYEHLFAKNRQNLIASVFNRRHASEVSGPTFTHVIDSNEMDILIENATRKVDQSINPNANTMPPYTSFYPSSYGNPIVDTNYLHNIETVDDETHKRMVDNFLRDTRVPEPSRHRSSSRVSKRSDRNRSKSPDRKRKRTNPVTITQWNIERRSVSPLRESDIWQAYRHMVDLRVRDLNTTFDVYKANAEEHPQYKDEWQKFWKRRKDELIAAGIDHRSYNYQSDWIIFFNARLEELYNQDVENIKIKCRERLCLPMTNDELENPKYHVNIPEDTFEREPEPEPASEPKPLSQPKNTPTAVRENSVENRSKSPENIEVVNVIHVLRLLTALENFLGSLGPSITEMLAKALQMSKIHPDKINQLILTNENCAILETAKEKFTGLIISKILDPNQERALKKAVNDTELLLDYAAEISPFSSWIEDSANKAKEERSTVSSSNSTAVFKTAVSIDKSALAAKLASSLISQGKTSINQDQLKKIIQVYSLMEQKKQDDSSLSRSISSVINTTNSSTNSVQTANELTMPGRNNNSTNSLAATQAPNQQTYNQNFNPHGYTNQVPFMSSDLNSMKTSSNYFNANMARTNNTTNMNNDNNFNPGRWDYTNSGQHQQIQQQQMPQQHQMQQQQQQMQQHQQQLQPQQSDYTQGFDSGQFTQNASSSFPFMGSQNSSATSGNKSVWGQYNWMN